MRLETYFFVKETKTDGLVWRLGISVSYVVAALDGVSHDFWRHCIFTIQLFYYFFRPAIPQADCLIVSIPLVCHQDEAPKAFTALLVHDMLSGYLTFECVDVDHAFSVISSGPLSKLGRYFSTA